MASKSARQRVRMRSSEDVPAGFVDGEAVLDELLAEPGMRKAVDLIHEGTAHMDRVHAEGLAEIRKLAAQTQAGLAERMGVKQAAVSRIEGRDDLLLSTLAEYAAAAGATNGRIVFHINGVDVELPLDRYQHDK